LNSNRVDSQGSGSGDSDKMMKTKALMNKKTTPEDKDDSPDALTPKAEDIAGEKVHNIWPSKEQIDAGE